jgi:hypothetical protein
MRWPRESVPMSKCCNFSRLAANPTLQVCEVESCAPQARESTEVLAEPVQQTLFFAGAATDGRPKWRGRGGSFGGQARCKGMRENARSSTL